MKIRLIILLIVLLISCTDDKRIYETPPTGHDNGGLILSQGFGALVVADSVVPARHLAVNSNGDKLKFGNEALKQMETLKQKSYLRIPDKELDLQQLK